MAACRKAGVAEMGFSVRLADKGGNTKER
jgi:hypothetical protein